MSAEIQNISFTVTMAWWFKPYKWVAVFLAHAAALVLPASKTSALIDWLTRESVLNRAISVK